MIVERDGIESERADAILKMLRKTLIELLETCPQDNFQVTLNVTAGGKTGTFEVKRRIIFQTPN